MELDLRGSGDAVPATWNDSRHGSSSGSFIRSCLEPFIAKIRMDMEIVYYEQEGGVLQKVAELLVQTRNGASLNELCREALKKRHDSSGSDSGVSIGSGEGGGEGRGGGGGGGGVGEGGGEESEPQLKCFSSLFAGEKSVEIDLTKKPNEVDCILEALQNDTTPVLYLFKEPSSRKKSGEEEDEDEEEEEGVKESPVFSRKGSGMVKEFIRTPRHSSQTTPDSLCSEGQFLSPVHSPQPSLLTSEEEEEQSRNMMGKRRRHSQLEPAHSSTCWEERPTATKHHGKKSAVEPGSSVNPSSDKRLLERVVSELYQTQDSVLDMDMERRTFSPQSGEEEEDELIAVENGISPALHGKSNGHLKSPVHSTSLPMAKTTPLLEQESYTDLLTILETTTTTTKGGGGNSEHHLSTSLKPSSSSSSSISSLPSMQFRPKLDTFAVHGTSEPAGRIKPPAFHTMTRTTLKNTASSRDAAFRDNFLRTANESYGYEGPPSPLNKEKFTSIVRGGEEAGKGGGRKEGTRSRVMSRMDAKKLTRKTAIRRQRRKHGSISEAPPETSYSYHVDFVQVSADGQTVHKVPCREFNTVGELKECVVKTLNRNQEKTEVKWKISDVVLVYSLNQREFELYNEYQFLYSTALYQSWTEEESTSSPDTTILRVRSARRTGDKDQHIMMRLGHLTGLFVDGSSPCLVGGPSESGCLLRVAEGDRQELEWARRLLHSYVKSEVAARDEEKYCLSMELVSRQTSTILALKIPLDNKVEITFHYQLAFSLVKKVNINRTAVSVLEELYQCVVSCGLIDQEKNKSSEFVLQVSGERSFIAGQNELLSFKDIRRCIIKSEPIHLSITPRPSPLSDVPFQIHMVPVDNNSGHPPLHTDITALSHKECDSQAFSIWDVKDELSLQVVRLDHLPVRQLPNKIPLVVEVSLYHGNTQLCTTQHTSPQQLNGLVRIKETLNFKIAKKDVPKCARYMFIVRESFSRKESTTGTKKTQTARFLYWGLISIIDHQNMLRTGEVQVALWRGSNKDGGDQEWYSPCPCAPACGNPDPKAVILTVKFDSYSFPVHYPSTIPQSWTSLLGLNEGNAALRKQFHRLLDLIKEGKLHGALPTYIEKLEWGNLSKTLEVYSLLTELMEAKHFPVETALKMLDSHFPDEHVRKFAVNALHELADDELEDILLQLTQALKFEPRHDSPLARLLLKRALHNKRIGHFFFWYLKCELHNPLYALRCGVILEAYLKGCGESMLRQFEDQVEIQMKLEEIAVELKQRCSDDQSKMQSLLPELLEVHGVPTFNLTPVYNPRIRLGNLRPNKCKVMSSKKKPQWLEMYNVDPTVLRQSPVRLILKLGDDLRQDMITLRMFSLFEKLWEEDGLSDLCLIPYGCLATGPKTGFIEVVNNARTIAEVSGVSNQTKLLDWISSHQTNEFGELDPEKLKMAVKKFTHSCAGYSVATYVLGIGDRHNDNIMVTTSGNLFHIDFGHFLGNIKYYMGFKREWAPFVLTPDFVYVMGGEEGGMFETYKNLCCRAFLTLRRNADLIINLFSLMRSTGIPELTCVEDTDYIRNALVLDKTEQEAEQLFRKVIKKCLDLKWTVQMMWKIHLLRKKGTP